MAGSERNSVTKAPTVLIETIEEARDIRTQTQWVRNWSRKLSRLSRRDVSKEV